MLNINNLIEYNYSLYLKNGNYKKKNAENKAINIKKQLQHTINNINKK